MENRFNFRAYIKKLNKVYDVYCLDYSTGKLRIKCCDKGGEMIINDVRNEAFNEFFDEEEFILMQSTTLKDKNKKEIYKGDIIKYKNTIRFITYNHQLGRLVASYINDINDYCDFNKEWISKYEVIGNIYENLEVIGKKL